VLADGAKETGDHFARTDIDDHALDELTPLQGSDP
jgi:hypothetical protein